MSCCMNKNKKKNKVHFMNEVFEPRPPFKDVPKKRRKSIYPMKLSKQCEINDNKKNMEEEKEKREAFTDKFLSEIIQCNACSEKIALKERKPLHNCSNCDRFFCCNFAGACVGSNCSINFEGSDHSLSYCNGCVNMYLKINIQDNGQCLCKKCEESSDIPNYYREI